MDRTRGRAERLCRSELRLLRRHYSSPPGGPRKRKNQMPVRRCDWAWRSRCAGVLAVVLVLITSALGGAGDSRKQYWATSLSGSVDSVVLAGLYEAVARGEVGWLDVDPKPPTARM